MEGQQPRYMDETEIRLAMRWKEEEDIPVAEIARRLGRTRSSIWRLFGDAPAMKVGVGRKAKLSEEDKDRLVKLVCSMVKTADTRYTVTARMVQARFSPRVCWRADQCVLYDYVYDYG